MADFQDLPDLASDAFGGAAIACNDEFFAEKENLVRAAAAVWKEHEYTDRGKWMDGWETRRYRPPDGVAPGPASDVHDWCVVRLGLPGRIRGIVVDTAFFRGNYPDSCTLHGACIEDPLDVRALEGASWSQILPRTKLEGDRKNAFAIDHAPRVTHVRLAIFPDGGVARLRVHGDVVPDWPRLHALGGALDLAALEHGAVVESCSDMFFGSRNNLIKPGASHSMADGWETRRRRGPGNEWAIVRLAGAGTIERVEIDTSHFKGNAPALCKVEGRHHMGDWRPLFATALEPHRRHVFDHQLRRIGPVTHLQLSVYPCGGVARLRAWGALVPEPERGLFALNMLPDDDARAALRKCCGSARWSDAMLVARPFEDVAAMLRIGERIWWSLDEADHREAFGAHPKIGERKGGDAWSSAEQAGAASAEVTVQAELAAANRAYEDKHGFIYIVCATGRGATDMLADLRLRLERSRGDELRCAAEEQAKITRLRLTKLIGELA